MNTFLGNPSKKIKSYIITNTPLCFMAVDAGATIALQCSGDLAKAEFETSVDKHNWVDYTNGEYITLTNAGDRVYFRAKVDNTSKYRDETMLSDFLRFATSQDSKLVNVFGNVMSILSPDFTHILDLSKLPDDGWSILAGLFMHCKSIKSCKSLLLPATKLSYNCYNNMFYGCTSLVDAPDLPAVEFDDIGNYYQMFMGCSSLVHAPSTIAATSVSPQCCMYMFKNCTSLTSAPQLPATSLEDSCYSGMFEGCTSLVSAPAELPATSLANRCYTSMFKNCTSLTSAPQLPATSFANRCYSSMFEGCISLEQAPVLKKVMNPSLDERGQCDLMLSELKRNSEGIEIGWGALTTCNWPDLTMSDVDYMISTVTRTGGIFGSSDGGSGVKINITCKDGNCVVFFDNTFGHWSLKAV